MEVMLPHYLYCNIVYSTITARNTLKYMDIQENRHELTDKKV